MKAFSKIKRVWTVAFCLIALAVWGMEVFWHPENFHYASYAFILLCFVTSLIYIDKSMDTIWQSVALLFTCVADYFLVCMRVQDSGQKTLAMAFFLVAQIAYAMRTLGFAKDKKEKVVNLALRVGLSLIAGVAAAIVMAGNRELPLIIISLIYYANLLLSILFSFMHAKEGGSVLITAIGLTAFACCDITIGLDFLKNSFSFGVGNPVVDFLRLRGVALFYTPSQTLLALSSYAKRQ